MLDVVGLRRSRHQQPRHSIRASGENVPTMRPLSACLAGVLAASVAVDVNRRRVAIEDHHTQPR
jgi:hypothetical protein